MVVASGIWVLGMKPMGLNLDPNFMCPGREPEPEPGPGCLIHA